MPKCNKCGWSALVGCGVHVCGPKTKEDFKDSLEFQRNLAEMLADENKTLMETIEWLKSDEAAHSWWNEETNTIEHLGKNHIGPSLMSAGLWAKVIEHKLKTDAERVTGGDDGKK